MPVCWVNCGRTSFMVSSSEPVRRCSRTCFPANCLDAAAAAGVAPPAGLVAAPAAGAVVAAALAGAVVAAALADPVEALAGAVVAAAPDAPPAGAVVGGLAGAAVGAALVGAAGADPPHAAASSARP